jgi:hypothetical protein
MAERWLKDDLSGFFSVSQVVISRLKDERHSRKPKI